MSGSFSLIISGCNTERQCGNLGDVELALTCSTIHMYISGCSNIFSYIFAS